MQNLVVVSHTVCAHVAGPKMWGRWGPAPWDRDMADPLETRFSHVCYRTKVRGCRSNRFGVRRGPIMGTLGAPPHWDVGVADP